MVVVGLGKVIVVGELLVIVWVRWRVVGLLLLLLSLLLLVLVWLIFAPESSRGLQLDSC